jgi:hypothetical protein
MSLPRFAAWGAVGGVLLSAIFVLVAALGADALLVLGPVFALAAAGCAAGSLALARMAEDGALPGRSADAGEAGFTQDEARGILGGGKRDLYELHNKE